MVRANISEELIDKIDEKIFIDLEIHAINQKIMKAEQECKDSFRNYLDSILKSALKKRSELGKYLKSQGVKISEPKRLDDMYVQYYYSVHTNGGYKEGYMKFWDAAIKMRLKKRLNKYFAKDGVNE